MKLFGTITLASLLAVFTGVGDAVAADYSPAGSDEITAALVASKSNQQGGELQFNAADGLQGVYKFTDHSMNNAGDAYTLYAPNECVIGVAPIDKYYRSIQAAYTGTSAGDGFDVYASATFIDQNSYSSGTHLGTLAAGGSVSVPEDAAYSYVVLVAKDGDTEVNSLIFGFKKEGEAEISGGVDHITPEALKNQNPGGNFDPDNWYITEGAENALLKYQGESGSEFEIVNARSNGSTFWSLANLYPKQSYCRNTRPGGYIKKITIKQYDNGWPEDLSFYVGENVMTNDDCWKNKYVYLQKSDIVDNTLEWEPDGFYQYIYIEDKQKLYTDISIEWSKEKPVLSARKPSISCYDDPFTIGSTVSVSADNGMKLNVKVYVNDVEDSELSKIYDENYASIKVNGKAGDRFKVEAFAFADGYNNSDVETFEDVIQLPLAESPKLSRYVSEVCPGMKLVLESSIENAKISYKTGYHDDDNSANNKELEDKTVDAPAEILVPADAPVGASFTVWAVVEAEGYQESRPFDVWFKIVSTKLDAPSFSIANGTEVTKGARLTIYRSNNASEIHYSINDGDAVVSTEYSVNVTIDDDMTVEAWCTGEEPFEASAHVVNTYTVEKFEAWQHVLTPEDFVVDEADYRAGSAKEFDIKSKKQDIDYYYKGGFWPDWLDNNTFYFSPLGTILYNKIGFEDGIKAIKVDSSNEYYSIYAIVSEEPVTELTDEIKGHSTSGLYDLGSDNMIRLRIGKYTDNGTENVAGFNEWVNLEDYVSIPSQPEMTADESDKKTFTPKYVTFFNMSNQPNQLTRFIIERNSHDNIGSGVGEIEAVNDGAVVVYNLNGVRVDGENLAPGIYIRKANGKTTKFVVK